MTVTVACCADMAWTLNALTSQHTARVVLRMLVVFAFENLTLCTVLAS